MIWSSYRYLRKSTIKAMLVSFLPKIHRARRKLKRRMRQFYDVIDSPPLDSPSNLMGQTIEGDVCPVGTSQCFALPAVNNAHDLIPPWTRVRKIFLQKKFDSYILCIPWDRQKIVKRSNKNEVLLNSYITRIVYSRLVFFWTYNY